MCSQSVGCVGKPVVPGKLSLGAAKTASHGDGKGRDHGPPGSRGQPCAASHGSPDGSGALRDEARELLRDPEELSDPQITAPFSFTIGRVEGTGAKYQPSQLYYRDGLEADRLTAIARSTGPSGEIIRDLAVSRNNCVKAAYMHHVRCCRHRAGTRTRPAQRRRLASNCSSARLTRGRTSSLTACRRTSPSSSASQSCAYH